jgi:hypothetical protein
MNYDSPEERDQATRKKMVEYHRKMMAKYGWYAHYVADDDDSPTGFNGHTHGFEESWKHPDIQIVIAMPQTQIHGIMAQMADLIKEGAKFEPGTEYNEVLQGYPVKFGWAREGGDRRVLRMILPDKQGRVARDEITEPFNVQWEGVEV